MMEGAQANCEYEIILSSKGVIVWNNICSSPLAATTNVDV